MGTYRPATLMDPNTGKLEMAGSQSNLVTNRGAETLRAARLFLHSYMFEGILCSWSAQKCRSKSMKVNSRHVLCRHGADPLFEDPRCASKKSGLT